MPKSRVIVSALFLALLSLVALPAHAATNELIQLPWTEWQFHPTDDPACATDSASCAWQHFVFARSWRDDGRAFFWVRREVRLPPELA